MLTLHSGLKQGVCAANPLRRLTAGMQVQMYHGRMCACAAHTREGIVELRVLMLSVISHVRGEMLLRALGLCARCRCFAIF